MTKKLKGPKAPNKYKLRESVDGIDVEVDIRTAEVNIQINRVIEQADAENALQGFTAIHVDAMLTKPILDCIQYILAMNFGNRTVSPLETLESISRLVHQYHLIIVQQGCSYKEICKTNGGTAEFKRALYIAASKCDPLPNLIADIATQIQLGHIETSEDMIKASTKLFAKHYAEKHITQQFEQEQGTFGSNLTKN